LTIKDLLTMSVGHATDPSGRVNSQDHWVKAFLNTPIVNQPGTKFLYNSVATYMLSAIVQKVTGQKILDYLKPRLFTPRGIEGIDWETDPDGINTGGWGLRLKTEDMAKFGQLFLQKGMWQGKQIVPTSWVEEASTKKIEQEPNATQARKDSNDWVQGYCYQMWRSRHNSYRGDGAFGQYILVLPDQDAVIIITSETTDMQGELNLVWKYLLPSFQNQKLPADAKMAQRLKTRINSLALPLAKSATGALESRINGKTFGIISNDRSFESARFDFKNDICQLTLTTDSAIHILPFVAGKWSKSSTTKYGPYLVARAKSNRVGLAPYEVAGNYSWKNEKTLELVLRYVESPHTEVISFNFEDDYVYVDFRNLFNQSAKRTLYKGVVTKNLNNPPQLIVRGDDMGFSHSANEALIKSYKEGIETSIEVIVPSPWFPEAVKLLKENPSIDVGLHFAITSEWDNVKWRPLTDCASLKNEDGYFYPMLYPNKNYPNQSVINNGWKIEDIEKELRAQIRMALKYIPRLSHVSGHMGSTAFSPEVKVLAKKIAAEYKLPMVDVDPATTIRASYTGFDSKNKTTEERIDAFINMLDRLEEGKTYVFVEHPGIDNEELRAIYHIGYEDVAKGRQDVTNIFTSERVKEALQRKGIKLVSYKKVIAQ
ncbi:MAG TPA: ChbG/HpnK family deacetylase, partial [Flavitalea sp.]|nr:ChbG/HpnK family deacetylase [Flavitalea sp.]